MKIANQIVFGLRFGLHVLQSSRLVINYQTMISLTKSRNMKVYSTRHFFDTASHILAIHQAALSGYSETERDKKERIHDKDFCFKNPRCQI